MTPSTSDRLLLDRCLRHEVGAWNDFVDQYLGLIYSVIHYTAHLRGMAVRPEDVEDLAAEVLLQLVANDYAALRQFQGRSKFSTYLTVIARRICVQELLKRYSTSSTIRLNNNAAEPEAPPVKELQSWDTLDEVQRLLGKLPKKAREVVRLHYLEGRSYEDISTQLNVPVNTIGPILSRARQFLRQRVHQRLQATDSGKS